MGRKKPDIELLGLLSEMFHLDSPAFLTFVFFHKLCECYTEEATSASYFGLCLLFCCGLPGPANLPKSCYARERRQGTRRLNETSMSALSSEPPAGLKWVVFGLTTSSSPSAVAELTPKAGE